jgi:hypothetical protein
MAKRKTANGGSKAKKAAKKDQRKQLEASITGKFLEAVKSLGHDAEAISKEIKKAGKRVAKKAAGKFRNVKEAVEQKFDSGSADVPKAKIRRAVKTVQKAEVRAGQVASQASAAAEKTVRKATARVAAVKEQASKTLEKAEAVIRKDVSEAAKAGEAVKPKNTATSARRRTPAGKTVPKPSPAAAPTPPDSHSAS